MLMLSEQNPFKLILRAFGLWMRGRVHFRDAANVENLTLKEDKGHEETFAAFRRVDVDPVANNERPAAHRRKPGAIFQVRFLFRNLSPAVNSKLSLIPIPLIVAQPGFRSKTWLLGQRSGAFLGHYEFDTAEDAEAYWNSLPLRMMKRRAAPGSITHRVIRIESRNE